MSINTVVRGMLEKYKLSQLNDLCEILGIDTRHEAAKTERADSITDLLVYDGASPLGVFLAWRYDLDNTAALGDLVFDDKKSGPLFVPTFIPVNAKKQLTATEQELKAGVGSVTDTSIETMLENILEREEQVKTTERLLNHGVPEANQLRSYNRALWDLRKAEQSTRRSMLRRIHDLKQKNATLGAKEQKASSQLSYFVNGYKSLQDRYEELTALTVTNFAAEEATSDMYFTALACNTAESETLQNMLSVANNCILRLQQEAEEREKLFQKTKEELAETQSKLEGKSKDFTEDNKAMRMLRRQLRMARVRLRPALEAQAERDVLVPALSNTEARLEWLIRSHDQLGMHCAEMEARLWLTMPKPRRKTRGRPVSKGSKRGSSRGSGSRGGGSKGSKGSRASTRGTGAGSRGGGTRGSTKGGSKRKTTTAGPGPSKLRVSAGQGSSSAGAGSKGGGKRSSTAPAPGSKKRKQRATAMAVLGSSKQDGDSVPDDRTDSPLTAGSLTDLGGGGSEVKPRSRGATTIGWPGGKESSNSGQEVVGTEEKTEEKVGKKGKRKTQRATAASTTTKLPAITEKRGTTKVTPSKRATRM